MRLLSYISAHALILGVHVGSEGWKLWDRVTDGVTWTRGEEGIRGGKRARRARGLDSFLVQGGCQGPRGVSDFVPCPQANKLACYCFMVANRLETSEFSSVKAVSRLLA